MTTATAEPSAAPEAPAATQAPPALRVIANRADLVGALSAAAAVVPSRTYKPVLACFRLVASIDGLVIEATNLEQHVRHFLPTVQVEQSGALCTPADDLLKACRELTGDTIHLGTDERGDELIVRSEWATVRMPALSAADFPPGGESVKPAGTVPASALLDMLGKAKIAIDPDGSGTYKPPAVYLECPKGTGVLRAVATDSRRLAWAECPWNGPAIFPGCMIPLASVTALQKGLDPEQDVGIAIEDREAAFSCGDFTLRTNLLEGNFPPYADIVPKDTDKRLTAGREALIATLRQAGLGAGERSKNFNPALRLQFTKAGLTAIGRHEGREAIAKLPCKWEGADLEAGFNLEWLLDGLNALASDEVSIDFTTHSRPLLIATPGFKYVLMPVNLK